MCEESWSPSRKDRVAKGRQLNEEGMLEKSSENRGIRDIIL